MPWVCKICCVSICVNIFSIRSHRSFTFKPPPPQSLNPSKVLTTPHAGKGEATSWDSHSRRGLANTAIRSAACHGGLPTRSSPKQILAAPPPPPSRWGRSHKLAYPYGIAYGGLCIMPTCGLTRVCWCRRIFIYTHTPHDPTATTTSRRVRTARTPTTYDKKNLTHSRFNPCGPCVSSCTQQVPSPCENIITRVNPPILRKRPMLVTKCSQHSRRHHHHSRKTQSNSAPIPLKRPMLTPKCARHSRPPPHHKQGKHSRTARQPCSNGICSPQNVPGIAAPPHHKQGEHSTTVRQPCSHGLCSPKNVPGIAVPMTTNKRSIVPPRANPAQTAYAHPKMCPA